MLGFLYLETELPYICKSVVNESVCVFCACFLRVFCAYPFTRTYTSECPLQLEEMEKLDNEPLSEFGWKNWKT